MYFVAVRKGLSEEVSFQLRTDRYRRARHEKSKRKWGPGLEEECKDQHTKKAAEAEGPGCPVSCASRTKLPPVSPAYPASTSPPLTRGFALQTTPNKQV